MNTNLQNGSAPQPKVAVIGAGSMGAGIAALCASAGLEVVLLDQDADAAARGVETQLKRCRPDKHRFRLCAVGGLRLDHRGYF